MLKYKPAALGNILVQKHMQRKFSFWKQSDTSNMQLNKSII